MKKYIKLEIKIHALILLTALAFACGKDDDPTEELLHLTTSTGQLIDPSGQWESGCVNDLDTNISEVLTFSNESIEVDIEVFQEATCDNVIGTNNVSITYRIDGTIQAKLDGTSVLANKISGLATQSGGTSDSFLQTLYFDDAGSEIKLYHARFESDGGDVTEDGYPIDLIPIAITKR